MKLRGWVAVIEPDLLDLANPAQRVTVAMFHAGNRPLFDTDERGPALLPGLCRGRARERVQRRFEIVS